jgi:hypothetical protein
MFRLAFDHPSLIAVGIFFGPENTDADFQAYIDSFDRLDRIGFEEQHERPVYALIVDPENPRPNAMWRKRIADASAHLRCNPLVSLITKSAAIRSVVTAINWFRPPPYIIKCHESLEAAAAWAGAHRSDDVLGIMRRLERSVETRTVDGDSLNSEQLHLTKSVPSIALPRVAHIPHLARAIPHAYRARPVFPRPIRESHPPKLWCSSDAQ